MTPATRWLDARYDAHVARRDGLPPLLVAAAEAREREAWVALASSPGEHSLGDGFGVEVRVGCARRSALP